MNLLNQFDDLVKEWKFETKQHYRNKAKEIMKIGLEIFRGYVPIDQEILKQSIKGEVFDLDDGLEIRIWVENRNLPYANKAINAVQLGMILEQGRGKSGVRLRRTKSNTYAGLGEPTSLWFDNACEYWFKQIQI